MNHVIIQKARSHKYIKRLGAPGDYEYFYKQPGRAKAESKAIMNKMDDLMKVFGQSEGMCGPASIRIALSAFGKSYSEEEVAHLAKSTAAYGTTHANMVNTVRTHGLHALTYQDLSKEHSLELLKNYVNKGDPVIVDWLKTRDEQNEVEKYDLSDPENEHYCVVSKVDDSNINLLDPEAKKEISMPIAYFMERWFTISERTNRWFLVLEKEK